MAHNPAHDLFSISHFPKRHQSVQISKSFGLQPVTKCCQVYTCCRVPNVMGSCGSLACRAYHDTGSGTSEDIFNLLAIRAHTRWGYTENQPGSPNPQSSLLLLRHRGGPVKPRKSQTKSPIYWSLQPWTPPPFHYIQLRKKMLGYRETKGEYIFIHYVSSNIWLHALPTRAK